MKWVLLCVPDLMWFREASIRSMKEAGTVIVFLVSSNMSSFRVMTLEEEKKKEKKKDLRTLQGIRPCQDS